MNEREFRIGAYLIITVFVILIGYAIYGIGSTIVAQTKALEKQTQQTVRVCEYNDQTNSSSFPVLTNDAVSFHLSTRVNYTVSGPLRGKVDKPIIDDLINAYIRQYFMIAARDVSYYEFMTNFPQIQNQVAHQLSDVLVLEDIEIHNVQTTMKAPRDWYEIKMRKPGIDKGMNESLEKLSGEKIQFYNNEQGEYILQTTI